MRFSSPRVTLFASLLLALVTSAVQAPHLEARLKKSPKKKAAAAAGPLVFRSRGVINGGGKARQRDRTITLMRTGTLVAVKIDDHVDNKRIVGSLDLAPDRRLVTDDPELMNAANLIAVTPAVLAALKSGQESVETEGVVEANGKVFQVVNSHTLLGAPGETTSVLTVTESENGKLSFQTRSVVDAQGIPLRATTKGKLKVFVFSADIDLTLERLSGTAL